MGNLENGMLSNQMFALNMLTFWSKFPIFGQAQVILWKDVLKPSPKQQSFLHQGLSCTAQKSKQDPRDVETCPNPEHLYNETVSVVDDFWEVILPCQCWD